MKIDSELDHVGTETAVETYAEVDRLGDEIAELSAYLEAATARLLDRIREFDARGGWKNGFRSCAAWLAWRVGLDLRAARDQRHAVDPSRLDSVQRLCYQEWRPRAAETAFPATQGAAPRSRFSPSSSSSLSPGSHP